MRTKRDLREKETAPGFGCPCRDEHGPATFQTTLPTLRLATFSRAASCRAFLHAAGGCLRTTSFLWLNGVFKCRCQCHALIFFFRRRPPDTTRFAGCFSLQFSRYRDAPYIGTAQWTRHRRKTVKTKPSRQELVYPKVCCAMSCRHKDLSVADFPYTVNWRETPVVNRFISNGPSDGCLRTSRYGGPHLTGEY